MEPISLILIALKLLGGAAAAGAAAYVVAVALDEIYDWFDDRFYYFRDPDTLAVTILDYLDSGEYSVVQGVFDTHADSFIETRTFRTRAGELTSLHNGQRVLIHDSY